ncbi:MAG TPA: catalase-peroxidase, partial [Bdellovibrionales bacterium]|nr:catalase-peroxidase [Bdellovibrionales bacterium]
EYNKISKRFLENPKEFERAFARAWFKLTHRDMGPRALYVGAEAPKEDLIWQDPIPAIDYKVVGDSDIGGLKKKIWDSGLTNAELVRTAWAAAASFRSTDKRGGANGGRLRLAPQKDWAVNNPAEIQKVLGVLGKIQEGQNKGSRKISMADLIVLGGNAGIERAAKEGGFDVKMPFTAGRGDSSQEQTDVQLFAVLEPKADAFRNFYAMGNYMAPLDMMIDRAAMLSLSVPEMTVLIGGLRSLDANTGGVKHGVLTNSPGKLSNDFFVNLLDMSTKWEKSKKEPGVYEGVDRKTGAPRWTATSVDLIFGSHSELRAISEVYASNDGKQKFAEDFIRAWSKVMNLDRFDLKKI